MLNSILIDSDCELQSIITDSRNTPVGSSESDECYRHMNSETEDEDVDPDSCSDYEIPSLPTIEEKEEYVKQAREDIQEMQKRFIWDLSFAMKRQLCAENFNTDAELKISDVHLDEIVDFVIKSCAPPSKWLSLILTKFLNLA